jgi:phosphatidylserine/phosphatidylglycerophosphate/cardiolipin synthase-like enzyme
MKKRTFIIPLLLVLLWFTYPSMQGEVTADIPSETSQDIEVFFCPQHNCNEIITETIAAATKVDCAFFDLNLEEVIQVLKEKNARVIMDNTNIEDLPFKSDTRSAFMHNKFCILDDKVVTGSTNPTIRGTTTNNNNLLIIRSKLLTKNYEDEFNAMWNDDFGRDGQVQHPIISLNNKKVENYFCPEDECEAQVLKTLDKANTSVHFMTFSFTSDLIGDKLLELNNKGMQISGVFEKSQKSKYSEFEKLRRADINVLWDSNPATMHHKVFIIDKEIVITGSYNPTNNGNKNNDENILIIHDKEIATKFLNEFIDLAG